MKISLKNTMKKVMRDISLNLICNTQKKCMNFIMTYHFYLKKKKKNAEKLVTNLHDENENLYT